MCEGALLISPPLRFSAPTDLDAWAASGKRLVAIVPEHDDYLQPPEAAERFAVVPQCQVVGVPDAKHLFVGHTEEVLDEVVRAVAPESWPLPRDVGGLDVVLTRSDDLLQDQLDRRRAGDGQQRAEHAEQRCRR